VSETTLAWPLEHGARVHRERAAVVDDRRTLSYAELHERVRRLGGALPALGLPRGAGAGILAGNSAAHLELWFALPAYGRVVNDLNFRLAPDELAFMLSDSAARVLFVDDARLELGRDLCERCGVRLVHLGEEYESLQDAAPAEPPDLPGDTLAAISYTGGTTGRPKGVMLSHANLVVNAKHFMYSDGLRAGDRYLHAGPLFHVADSAMVFCIAWAGGAHVMLERFDVAAFVDAVERHAVTVAVLVPTMIKLLLDHLEEHPTDLASLRLLHYAAAPIAPALQARMMAALQCDFVQGYGMTEAAPGLTVLTPEEHRRGEHLGSVGAPLPGVQIAIDAPDGEVGEVLARGPNIMLGYWKRPEATREVLGPDGWYRTGDAGYFQDGRLYLVDRLKDMIISGGENVYPVEVERAIASFPGVEEVAVVGRSDERWGERVHAVIVGAGLDPAEIVAHCRTQIGGYKLPRSFEFRTEPLPKSGAGKVLKGQLR
jgi:long-chain acyl-CoA synthetase